MQPACRPPLGCFCGTDGSGCGTGASSGPSEGAGSGGDAGGLSGGDGQGQSGQMTMHMGMLLGVRVPPTMCWPYQRNLNVAALSLRVANPPVSAAKTP